MLSRAGPRQESGVAPGGELAHIFCRRPATDADALGMKVGEICGPGAGTKSRPAAGSSAISMFVGALGGLALCSSVLAVASDFSTVAPLPEAIDVGSSDTAAPSIPPQTA